MRKIIKIFKDRKGDIAISYLFIIIAGIIVGILVAWWVISIWASWRSKPVLNVRPSPVVLVPSTGPPYLVCTFENLGSVDMNEQVRLWVVINGNYYPAVNSPLTYNFTIRSGASWAAQLPLNGVSIPQGVGQVKIVIQYSGGTLEFTAVVSRG